MEITRRADYGIRIILALARLSDEERVSARELGALQDVPYPFARSILTELVGCGFVSSRRGSGGGFRLTRDPAEITLLEVVEALEGPASLNLCTRDPGYCSRAADCHLHGVWSEAERRLRRYLGSQDFAALARATDRATADRGRKEGCLTTV